MTLTPGAFLGPYEVAALIGEGGMGKVYRAIDTRLGRAVALKVIAPDLAAAPERLDRFRREGKALAALARADHRPACRSVPTRISSGSPTAWPRRSSRGSRGFRTCG